MEKSKICDLKINSVFEDGSTSNSTVFFRFSEFRSGDFSLKNELHGRP